MYQKMLRIRSFENRIYKLFLQGAIPGTVHLSAGQEAVAVGVCTNLLNNDYILGTHRSHGHYIAKGGDMKRLMAELYGRRDGCCKGKGSSMHVGDFSKGMIPAIAIVGANVPIGDGIALSFKMRKTRQVAAAFFGEGTVNHGMWHEGANLAAVWDLPLILVCENNLYAASTHISKTSKVQKISDRAHAYGMRGVTVDGNDVMAVHKTAGEAIRDARNGKGPTLIECLTYRRGGHSRGDPATYRPKEEMEQWLSRDPIPRFRSKLIEEGFLTPGKAKEIETSVEADVDGAVKFAENSPWPEPEAALEDTYDASPIEAEEPGESGEKQLTLSQAIREALREEMRRDDRVFLIGEDIGIKGGFGGPFGVTLGLSEEFGSERVRDTPISEAAIVGTAVGAAIMDMKPVAEVQYGDFIFCAMDQVVNEAAKLRYMSGGQVKVPLVLRVPTGATGRGAQHAQSPEAFFLHVPELKIVAPSTPYDAKGLMKASIRADDGPVLFFEHKLLYGSKGYRSEKAALQVVGPVPDGDYLIPFGKAKVRREGSDVTIVAKLLMVYKALAAAEELSRDGIEAEVIDPRTLAPFDKETVADSVKKTGRLVVVEEDTKTNGWGAEVVAAMAEEVIDYLDAPMKRVSALDLPIPASPPLENYVIPSEERIVQTIRQIL
jgi:pyruvate/2-oxoglutarate/acetoin dehydrogenase E1 component/TPP-dependent pyruvate/acetoin dehydrogenase alpha subunit